MGRLDPKWTQAQRDQVIAWQLEDGLKPAEVVELFRDTYGDTMPYNTIVSLASDERRRRRDERPDQERIQAITRNCVDMLETATQAEKTGQPCDINVARVEQIAKAATVLDKLLRGATTPTAPKPDSPLAKLNRSDKPYAYEPPEEPTEVSGSLPSSRAA